MNTKFFRNKHGRVVITQAANPPIIIWFVLTLINFGVHSPKLAWLATAFLFAWAVMELYLGDSPFRRLLGLLVLAGIIYLHLR